MLAQSVSYGSTTMLRGKDANVVRFPFPASRFPKHHPGFHFLDLDVELNSLHPELNRLAEQLLRPLRPIQPHPRLAPLPPHRPDPPEHPDNMIGMKMRKEDLRQRKPHPLAHHPA